MELAAKGQQTQETPFPASPSPPGPLYPPPAYTYPLLLRFLPANDRRLSDASTPSSDPRRGGEWCHPRGPASSEVTRAQQAHQELRSLECSWGTEVLSTPQDLPSTRTFPAGLALCALLPVTLWVSQGAPQTKRPVHPSGVQSWAGGRYPSDPQIP